MYCLFNLFFCAVSFGGLGLGDRFFRIGLDTDRLFRIGIDSFLFFRIGLDSDSLLLLVSLKILLYLSSADTLLTFLVTPKSKIFLFQLMEIL